MATPPPSVAAGARELSAIARCLEAVAARPPPPSDYPPVASIPRTSFARLAAAAVAGNGDASDALTSIPALPTTTPSAPSTTASASEASVLYLAYGSNLCAETFLGVRGIRPLSQVNVSAPSLRLAFDLPGMPYREPCFANALPRKIPTKPPPIPPVPPLPDPPPFKPAPPAPPSPPSPTPNPNPNPPALDPPSKLPIDLPPGPPWTPRAVLPGDPAWDGGLFGVVYEVTASDFGKIIATEGGGASYSVVLVPCLALPPRLSVPERPPEFPRPFLARTLCSVEIPDPPPDEPDDPENPDPRKKWWWRFVARPHREDGYAQPSARYLKLITDGAAEHDLPEDYQAYLNSLQPYTITTVRQRIAQLLLTVFYAPFFLVYVRLQKLLADDKGNIPRWLGIGMAVVFNVVWMSHDTVLKPVFGDGERTEEKEKKKAGAGGDGEKASVAARLRFGRDAGTDEEKASLLS